MANRAYIRVTRFLGSRGFFYVILTLFVFQALWIAFSFNYPMIYDEQFHFDIIKIYSHQLSPIITSQPPAYDYLRDLTHESSHFYHYLMSFPYRILALFVKNIPHQVVILRSLNILLVAVGLFLYSRVFRLTGIKQAFINISLLFFIMLPIVPHIAANINYDNMLFPLTALYLLLAVKLIKSNRVEWRIYAGLAIVGCFASLVKYTFLPIFAVTALYLGVVAYKRHGNSFLKKLYQSARTDNKLVLGTLIAFMMIFASLFSFVYLKNIVLFHTPQPDCSQSMAVSRCLKSDIFKRNMIARTTKDQREAMSLPDYGLTWIQAVESGSDYTAQNIMSQGRFVVTRPLPLIYLLTTTFTLIGIIALAYSWRALQKNESWYFLFTTLVVLTTAVFLDNVHNYYSFHAPYAMQPRYLLSTLPIFLVMVTVALNYIMRNYQWLKFGMLIVVFLVSLNGGGAITHVLLSRDDWYWQNKIVIKANHAAKDVLHPLVKE